MASKAGGFTLIELMIVVAVLAILAAIAFPSYQEHVRKARRAQAKADLVARYRAKPVGDSPRSNPIYAAMLQSLDEAVGRVLRALDDAVPEALYHDDVHGRPDWRRHMTRHFAEEIRGSLDAAPSPGAAS